MKYPAPRQESRILHCVHAAQVILVLASFIIAIARLAFYGGPRSRMDVWIIAVVSRFRQWIGSQIYYVTRGCASNWADSKTMFYPTVSKVTRSARIWNINGTIPKITSIRKHESIHDLKHGRIRILVCSCNYKYYGNVKLLWYRLYLYWYSNSLSFHPHVSSDSRSVRKEPTLTFPVFLSFSFLALITTIITTRQFYYRKKHGHHPDEQHWTRVLGRSYSDNSFDMPGNKV